MDKRKIIETDMFVIVLNWNGKKIIKKCLDSLFKISHAKITIIIVDNNSLDGSIEFIKKYYPNITIIRNNNNLGWAGGNNVGIDYALRHKAKSIMLLNNDVIVDRKSIEILYKKLCSKKEIGIVGPITYWYGKKKIIADAGGIIKKNRFFGINRAAGENDIGQYGNDQVVDFISGSVMLVKTEVFKKIGFFDERFFLYYEDADFCIRAKKANYLSIFVPQAIVFHKFAGTVGLGSPLHNYYTTRNHYLFVEKEAPLTVKLHEWLRTPKTFYEFLGSKDDRKRKYSILGIRDYYLRRFGRRRYW